MTHLPKWRKLSSKKVRQKVESFFKRCAKKWSTFPKSASKSGAPMKISGVLGDFAPNKMHFAMGIQNAYLAKVTRRTFSSIRKGAISKIFAKNVGMSEFPT